MPILSGRRRLDDIVEIGLIASEPGVLIDLFARWLYHKEEPPVTACCVGYAFAEECEAFALEGAAGECE